jgi:hypothetical protein
MKNTTLEIFEKSKAIKDDLRKIIGPPEEGLQSTTQQVLPFSIVKGSRGYIEKVVNQINGCYENGWYDGCAVMIRRLVETLIIESFEHHDISNNIQNQEGDFLFLRELISATLSEATWNIGRNTKKSLPKLKDIGDKSAHSRRYIAHRADIEKIIPDLRVVVQELVYLARLK